MEYRFCSFLKRYTSGGGEEKVRVERALHFTLPFVFYPSIPLGWFSLGHATMLGLGHLKHLLFILTQTRYKNIPGCLLVSASF